MPKIIFQPLMIANPSKRLTEDRKIVKPSERLTVKANWSQIATGLKLGALLASRPDGG